MHFERVADRRHWGTVCSACSVPLVSAMGKSVRGKKVDCVVCGRSGSITWLRVHRYGQERKKRVQRVNVYSSETDPASMPQRAYPCQLWNRSSLSQPFFPVHRRLNGVCNCRRTRCVNRPLWSRPLWSLRLCSWNLTCQTLLLQQLFILQWRLSRLVQSKSLGSSFTEDDDMSCAKIANLGPL